MKTQNYLLKLFTSILFLTIAFYVQGQSLTPNEELGKEIFFDKISSPDNMSCATCHGPSVGFTGPIPGINSKGSVYPGAVHQRFGNRKPPTSAYATLSPIFQFNSEEGLFFGGNFWDGRATGEVLGNPAADQAGGPFLNPVEQNNPDKQAVLMQIANSNYADLWADVWGDELDPMDISMVDANYDRVALSIADYENSPEVNAFTSKYDYYLKGLVELTDEEEWGLELFDGKGQCALCHPSEGEQALFTDFTFDNLGIPKNPDNPFYDMDEVYLDNGDPINPQGDAWIDYGLGGVLASHSNPDWQSMAGENMGKHKVPTLRNVDKRPGNGFPKAFGHNGVFKSLKDIVHFYNTRDVDSSWPPPEVAENINVDELGNLGLTDAEEDAIIAFMSTLSDGYKIPKVKKSIPAPDFDLELTFQNPAGESARISFVIPHSSEVRIDLYNLAGQKLDTILDGRQFTGKNTLDFSTIELKSGVYILNMQACDMTLSRKISIIH